MLAAAPFRWTDPGTWPWIVFVWIAMLLLGGAKPLWKWLRRRQATDWPTAQGRIESVSVQPPALFYALHVGAIAIWFPAVFVAQRRVGSINRKRFWKLVMRDAPEWMRYMVYFFFAYALINFAIFSRNRARRAAATRIA